VARQWVMVAAIFWARAAQVKFWACVAAPLAMWVAYDSSEVRRFRPSTRAGRESGAMRWAVSPFVSTSATSGVSPARMGRPEPK